MKPEETMKKAADSAVEAAKKTKPKPKPSGLGDKMRAAFTQQFVPPASFPSK